MALTTPVAISATNITQTSFRANWNVVSGATSYTVYLSGVSNFATLVSEKSTTALNYNFSGLNVGTTYYYKVVARNSTESSADSNVVTVTTNNYTPVSTPVQNPANDVNNDNFTVSWSSDPQATLYTVEISGNVGFSSILQTLTTTSTSKKIIGLTPETTYYTRIKATNPLGSSSYSNIITTVTIAVSAGVGTAITAQQYNALRAKVVGILGTGVGQSGYGQTLVSSAVALGNQVTKEQWDNLRWDIVTIKKHQDGELPNAIEVPGASVIRYGAANPLTNYVTLADQGIANKFELATGNTEETPNVANQSYTGTWSSQAQLTLSVTFLNNNDARYFFNSGGKIRFFSTFEGRTGATNPQQNTAWKGLLNQIGNVNIGGAVPIISNFYTLTTSYQTVYQQGNTSPYSANFYRIEALCNCSEATNVNGTSNVITFRVTWKDDYVDPGAPTPPGDEVDGTLTLRINEIKAKSPKYPEDSTIFNIASPTYSISSITAS